MSAEAKACPFRLLARKEIVNGRETWKITTSTLYHTCSSSDTFIRGNLGVADYMSAGLGGVAGEVSKKGTHGVMRSVSALRCVHVRRSLSRVGTERCTWLLRRS